MQGASPVNSKNLFSPAPTCPMNSSISQRISLSRSTIVATAIGALTLSGQAFAAQPTGTGGAAATASAGQTELEQEGFTTAQARPEELTDELSLSLQAGGIVATGNSRTAVATARADFRLRRNIHQFEATLAGNWGGAWPEKVTVTPAVPGAAPGTPGSQPTTTTTEEFEKTAQNIQGRARYDYFFHPRWSAFAMGTARYDPLQFLDLRLNVDPGVAFYALVSPEQRLWFEAGYDFQYDIYTKDAKDKKGAKLEGGSTHASRLFAGYQNQMLEGIGFLTGLEYLQSLTAAKQHRINWDNALTLQLRAKLSLAATFTLRYESREVETEGFKPVDTITSLNIVYQVR